MTFNNLLISQLAGVKDTEVVVSHVTVPANTKLPMHWHPGEEFAYVLDGSFDLIQKDQDTISYHKGDVGVVPLKQEHTIETHDKGAVILIFRVHEQGEPERVLV